MSAAAATELSSELVGLDCVWTSVQWCVAETGASQPGLMESMADGTSLRSLLEGADAPLLNPQAGWVAGTLWAGLERRS